MSLNQRCDLIFIFGMISYQIASAIMTLPNWSDIGEATEKPWPQRSISATERTRLLMHSISSIQITKQNSK
jgi:hypothetical protein